jgi:hypothetical protein
MIAVIWRQPYRGITGKGDCAMHPYRQFGSARMLWMVCALLAAACTAPASAQGQPQAPAGQAQPQQQQLQLSAPKAYEPVAVKLAEPYKDPSFDAFRKQLADVVKRKDRAALQRLVVTQGFFWESESGDKINKKRSSFENFAAAVALDDKDGAGWELLALAAADPTVEPVEDRKDTMCSPASPQLDETKFEALIKATETDAEEWGFPLTPSLEVRAAAQPNAPVIETLGMNLVRVYPEEVTGNQPPEMLRVVGPSGKVGYVPLTALAPIVFDQLCYVKQGGSWKITGYAGGE